MISCNLLTKYKKEIAEQLKDVGSYVLTEVYTNGYGDLGVTYRPAGTRLAISTLIEHNGEIINVLANNQ